MYQLTDHADIIKCTETGTFIPRGHWMWGGYQEWLMAGNVAQPAPPPYALNSPEHQRVLRGHAWEWMLTHIQARGYDSIESCCSYINSSVQRFAQEAVAMVAWRDAVSIALQRMAIECTDGVQTWEQLKVLLPQPAAFEWPAADAAS